MKGRLSALFLAGALLAGALFPIRARAEEPRAEEPRAEEPRAEEPDVEAPGVGEPGVGEPGAYERHVEEPRSTIAVVAAPGDRFGLQVRAELEAMGFAVAMLDDASEPMSRATLEASARKAGAIAAIRAVPSDRGVEVWIADRVTGKTVLRELTSDDDALAVSVVELLRASLLESALPAPTHGDVQPTPEIRTKMRLPMLGALASRPAPTLRISLAPGVLASPGGFGAAAYLDLGLAWMPSEHVGLAVFAAIPVTSPRVEDARASADIAALLVGGGMRFLFATPASRWAPSLDLGVTAISLHSYGMPQSGVGLFAGSASAITASPFASVGCAFAVNPLLRLRADVLVSGVVQGVSVQVAAREIATWGRPLVLTSAGIDFGWF